MRRPRGRVWAALAAALVMVSTALGQTADRQAPDLTKEPTLYVVGYAHLDTQ
jgi:alpha-mannosidase